MLRGLRSVNRYVRVLVKCQGWSHHGPTLCYIKIVLDNTYWIMSFIQFILRYRI
jgi:hypothetical protein